MTQYYLEVTVDNLWAFGDDSHNIVELGDAKLAVDNNFGEVYMHP